ncbi:hypothetical protein [Bosea vaviloviae]|uniref:Uncharacterized protein n=1 Tax=Bosea vaviloviae TaxID=1526658 RepID=A0A1D7U494_9HYPH|nr:hypothetical protein [Bosea vaviloviae]AOO82196.1 hypothetical protein BHK69_18690 [Bosea vaviloviae]
MCRIGFGVCVIRLLVGLVIGSVALLGQRHSDLGSVLFRQVKSPFDPWLAGLRNGMQSRVDALGRQLAPDEFATDIEMKRWLALGIERRAQTEDETGEQEIDLRHAQAFRVLIL